MKYGASTLMKGTVEQFFDRARDSFEAVEIVCDSPYRRPLEINTEFLRSVRGTVGVEYTVHCPFTRADIGSLNDSTRQRSIDEILEAIEVGFLIGASVIVVHPAGGSRGSIEERDRIRALEGEALVRINEYANSKNIRVCLENMPAGFAFADRTLASGIMHLVKGLDGAGVTFDVGHAKTTTVAPEKMLAHFGNLVAHVHVHDNSGRGDEHLEVGTGSIDWRSVSRALILSNYEGILMDESLSVEAAKRGVEFLKRIAEEVRRSEGNQ